jgi:ADP-ribose pyrophosphatase YjhB (NUDIX family)
LNGKTIPRFAGIWSISGMAAFIPEKLKLRLLHLSFVVARPMTLGVRGIVISAADEVLLVRHGYVSGWHFPGGGVEVGETFVESLTRELEEEARIAIEGPPVLHGLFFNTQTSKRDHVAAYVVRNFKVLGQRAPDWEIREARFFPREALPEGTTRATQARLAEIFDSAPLSDRW